MQDEEFQSVMGGVFAVISAVMILFAAIAAVPRAIAGIMGLSRSSRPEKSGFFMAWGIVLLICGVIGMLFSGGVFSLNGAGEPRRRRSSCRSSTSSGSSQQKKAYLASLSAAQGARHQLRRDARGQQPQGPARRAGGAAAAGKQGPGVLKNPSKEGRAEPPLFFRPGPPA